MNMHPKYAAKQILLNEYDIHWGDTVYTMKDGSFVRCYIVSSNGDIDNITKYVADAIGMKPRDRHGRWWLHVPGHGFNKSHHVVSRLSQELFVDEHQLQYQEL